MSRTPLIASGESKFLRLQSEMDSDDSLIDVATLFIGTPYVAGALDRVSGEPLVAALDSLDCTTFVESALALWYTGTEGTYSDYCSHLEALRYRDGVRDGYVSRLHYFSEWCADHATRGFLVSAMPDTLSALNLKEISFMGDQSDKYVRLRGNSSRIDSMRSIERMLTKRGFVYVPQANISALLPSLASGDIIGFTTSLGGLDILHVGFVLQSGDFFYLLHAPRVGERVSVSSRKVDEIVISNKNYNGVVVWRSIKR